jgi:nitrate/nitrite transporter NarK
LCDPIGGWLSDRFGRKLVMIAPWLVLLVVTVPGFWLVAHFRTAGPLIALTGALTICSCIAEASILVSVTESLPAKIRCGALGLIYAFAISVFGGSTQFAVAWLTDVTGSPLAPAWYLTGAIAITLIAMWHMPESAPRKLAH